MGVEQSVRVVTREDELLCYFEEYIVPNLLRYIRRRMVGIRASDYSLCTMVENSDDVVQHVRIQLANNTHILAEKDSEALKAWCYRVAANKLINYWRRAKSGAKYIHVVELADWKDREPASVATDPQMHAFQGCDRATVERMMARIPPHYAYVLRCTYFEGMTDVAIGMAMDPPRAPGAVRQIRMRAIAACRNTLPEAQRFL